MAALPSTEILDLRHVSARQMRPLLEAEARLWEQTLRWDYRSSTELLLEYLNGRVLPGFVTVENGEVNGFTFCVNEGHKAVVGDAFAQSAFARAPGDEGRDPTLNLLLTHLVSLLRASPGVDRIEAQLLLFPSGSLNAFFAAEGFTVFPRLFMECDLERYRQAPRRLAALPESLPKPLASGEFVLRRWTAADFQPAAELIHLAYASHVDARINDQYRTLNGSLRFLHNIVRFPGCGVFEANHSWVLEHRRSGTLRGVLLCSRVADDVAHITQLCVAPDLRGQHLGSHLLRHTTDHLTRAGYAAITLTVSEENRAALSLYQTAGFTTRRRFDAAVLERPQTS